MNLSRKWLADYTKIEVDNKEFADRLTMSGSKVELVRTPGDEIKNVVAGRVAKIKRHPDSDHLWVCAVDVGKDEPVQIVTGAQNVSAGDMVPVALHKSMLPGGKKIEKGKLRGVKSEGMLCSLSELALDKHDYPYADEDGIFIMQEPCSPGDDIRTIIGADDSIAELEITNNRPDCLSIIGLAREAAATFGTELTIPEPVVKGSDGDIRKLLSVKITDTELCPRYTARMIKNIKIRPSPAWMRQRLRACGVRPINNIVDITNYVMLEYGQPMHAFDYDCLVGGKIVVRTAEDGETMNTLDGTARTLTSDMLVIADANKPVGIAGVMGGENSEITENTRYVVFESANFNGVSVRKTALALALRTDSSHRFEKGLDVENTYPAVLRACELVELLDAGEVVGGVIDTRAYPSPATRLDLAAERVNRLLGADIPASFMEETLGKLGFDFDGDVVTVPSWRADVRHYSDLAEEVARFYGYDVIVPTLPGGSSAGELTAEQRAKRKTGELCRALGFSETYSYSFIGPSDYDRACIAKDSPLRRSVTILNPLGEDTSVMRTSSLPSMLTSLSKNASYRNADVRLYELATVYREAGGVLPDERPVLTLGAYGGCDFFALKGRVEAILRGLRVLDIRFEALRDNPSYHPGRAATVLSGGVEIGVVGQIHPSAAKNYGLGEAYAAELDFQKMLETSAPESVYTPIPRYPAVSRDIAVVCDARVAAGSLTECIRRSGGKLLRDVRLFDVYTGGQVPAGKKSVAFALTLRAHERTLTDEDADDAVNAILAALNNELGAVIR